MRPRPQSSSGVFGAVTSQSTSQSVSRKLRGPVQVPENNGRGGGIRTPGFLLPKQARYQTAPRPELSRSILF